MISREDNERLTRVGPGTPMGALLRRYWIPAAFSGRVAKPDSPPIRVRLLCEDLVLFRDSDGRVGLLDEHCPHRNASLFFGRNEECGLRCVYHGLKFDVEGRCVDAPSEPEDSNVRNEVRVKAYPCLERAGLVWAYMGPPEHKPDFPDLEWTRVPEAQRYISRHVQECNWLQGLEGGFDTPHLTYLHSGDVKLYKTVATRYEVIPTEFGFVVGDGREVESGDVLWNVNVMLMPFHKVILARPISAHIWTPIDDENTMLYSIDFNPQGPFTDEELTKQKSWNWLHTENVPGTDVAIRNKSNDYLIDRALQASRKSYTGIVGIGAQDCAIQESMGPIVDRSTEYLLFGDVAIVKIRRLLLQTLKDHAAGKPLPGMDPASYRVRSATFEAPKAAPFTETMWPRVRLDPPSGGSRASHLGTATEKV
jgi:nitrite reductase/ring-hydroxylating ferredoxin subunit